MNRLFRISVSTLLTVLIGVVPFAAAQGPTEYDVKAAFLFNFAKFIEWSSGSFASPNAPIVIVILGEDPFGETLDRTISGKTIDARRVEIKRLKEYPLPNSTHILFISPSEQNDLAMILENIRGLSVLTVGDMDQFAQQGGIINFVMNDGRVGFEINTDAADRAGLKLSSKLLKLAKIVRD